MYIFTIFRVEGQETIQLSEETVNPGKIKLGPKDFELKKVLGKGGYGKVFQVSSIHISSKIFLLTQYIYFRCVKLREETPTNTSP